MLRTARRATSRDAWSFLDKDPEGPAIVSERLSVGRHVQRGLLEERLDLRALETGRRFFFNERV